MLKNGFILGITGRANTGKTTSLRHLKNIEGVLRINCDVSQMDMPFISNIKKVNLNNPLEIFGIIEAAKNDNKIHTIVIDTLTSLVNLYTERVFPTLESAYGNQWKEFTAFFNKLLVTALPDTKKVCIVIAHSVPEEDNKIIYSNVALSGQLGKKGFASFFDLLVVADFLDLESNIELPENKLFKITDDEKLDQIKYILQVRKMPQSVHNPLIRHPIDFWDRHEAQIDSNIQLVLDRMDQYRKK